jgi:hypothetical protein
MFRFTLYRQSGHGSSAVQMTKAVAAAEAEAEKQKRNKAGLDAVLASLQAAKKVNVLDKSRSDWKDFKRSDSKASITSAALRPAGPASLRHIDSCHLMWNLGSTAQIVKEEGGRLHSVSVRWRMSWRRTRRAATNTWTRWIS